MLLAGSVGTPAAGATAARMVRWRALRCTAQRHAPWSERSAE
jgi:hypothetical protein